MKFILSVILLFTDVLTLISSAAWFYNSVTPLIIANQGASGYFPEHSIASYTDAFLTGADFIEITV
jgi:glycerophosphoryl diester phosphodiesterase